MSEGFRQSTESPFPQSQPSREGHRKTGKLLRSRQPSWIWRRCPRWLWNYICFEPSGAHRGGSEVTVRGRPGGAAGAEARVFEPQLQVVSLPRRGFSSGVASCEGTRRSGEDRAPPRAPFFLFLAPGVKSQRNFRRPPGPAGTCPQRSRPLSPSPLGAQGARAGLAGGGGGWIRRRHGEVPEGRPGRCRSCVTLPLFNGPVSVRRRGAWKANQW